MKISLAALALALPLSALAASPASSSVCIVSAAEDVVVCDGKIVQSIPDTTEGFSLALKSLLVNGYKIVSQGGGDKPNYQTWTLVKS